MSLSFPVSFLLGSALADSVGVKNQADRVASGVALAMTGGSPVGIVLARQLAINRASAQVPAPVSGVPATTGATPAPAATPPAGPSPKQEHAMDKWDEWIKQWIGENTRGDKDPKEVKELLIAALQQLLDRVKGIEPDKVVDTAGINALIALLTNLAKRQESGD